MSAMRIVDNPDLLPKPDWRSGSEMLGCFMGRFRSRTLPKPFPFLGAFAGFEFGPFELTVVGAPPGTGKTALATQLCFELTELRPELSIYIANAESSFDMLVMREISRRTGLSSSRIRRDQLSDFERDRVEEAAKGLTDDLGRFQWLDGQIGFVSLVGLRDQVPGVLIIDYLQKFVPQSNDVKVGIANLMSTLRDLAKLGWAVLALSATNRASYGNHSQASFRDSSEIEFNADAAYIIDDLEPESKSAVRHLKLRCVKNRHDIRNERELDFDGSQSCFTVHNEFVGDFNTSCINPFGEDE